MKTKQFYPDGSPIASLPGSWAGGASSLDGQFHVVRTQVLLQSRPGLICNPQGLFCQVQSTKPEGGSASAHPYMLGPEHQSRFCCPFLVIAWQAGRVGALVLLSPPDSAAVQFRELSEAQVPFLLVFHWSLSKTPLRGMLVSHTPTLVLRFKSLLSL